MKLTSAMLLILLLTVPLWWFRQGYTIFLVDDAADCGCSGFKTYILQSEICQSEPTSNLVWSKKSAIRRANCTTRLVSSKTCIILTVRKKPWPEFYFLGMCTVKYTILAQSRFCLFSRLAGSQTICKLSFAGKICSASKTANVTNRNRKCNFF